MRLTPEERRLLALQGLVAGLLLASFVVMAVGIVLDDPRWPYFSGAVFALFAVMALAAGLMTWRQLRNMEQ